MKRIAALALLLAAWHPAWAQDSRGAYMGLSIGEAYFHHSCDGAPAGIRCDNSDTAARVFAGYQFKPSFAMELGFHGLGAIAAQGSGPATVTQTADVSAIDFVFVGSWALGNRFSLLGKLGFYFGRMAVDATPSTGASRNWESRNTNDITYGLGAAYALTDRADFRLEWQHFGHFGTGTAPELDIHLFSLGALYRF